MEGKPNQLYAQGMRSFEQYDEICKYFAEGKQRDNDANEIQKHLQLYDLSLGEYLVNPILDGVFGHPILDGGQKSPPHLNFE